MGTIYDASAIDLGGLNLYKILLRNNPETERSISICDQATLNEAHVHS